MYDPYYETKVIPSWGKTTMASALGVILALLGLFMMIFSVADLAAGVTPEMGSAWQENSIWPTIGKGIWVGAIVSITIIPFFATIFNNTVYCLAFRNWRYWRYLQA